MHTVFQSQGVFAAFNRVRFAVYGCGKARQIIAVCQLVALWRNGGGSFRLIYRYRDFSRRVRVVVVAPVNSYKVIVFAAVERRQINVLKREVCVVGAVKHFVAVFKTVDFDFRILVAVRHCDARYRNARNVRAGYDKRFACRKVFFDRAAVFH